MQKKIINPTSLQWLILALPKSSKEFTQSLKQFYAVNHISDGKYGVSWDKSSTQSIFEIAQRYIFDTNSPNETLYNAYRVIGIIVCFNKYLYPYFERLLVLIGRGIAHPYGNVRTTVWHIVGDMYIFFDPMYRKPLTKAIQGRRGVGYEFYQRILEQHDEYERLHKDSLDPDDLTAVRQYTPWSGDTKDKILKSYRNILSRLTRGIWLEEYVSEHEISYYMDGWILRIGQHKNLENMKQYLDGQIEKSVMDGFFALLCGEESLYSLESATYWIEKNIPDHITKKCIVEIAREESLEACAILEKCLALRDLHPTLREWVRMGILYIEKIWLPMRNHREDPEDEWDWDFHMFSALGEYQWLPRYIIGVEIIDIRVFSQKSDKENINSYYILRDIPTRVESIEISDTFARISLGVSHTISVDTTLDALFFYYNLGGKCVKKKCLVTNTDIPNWQEIRECVIHLPEKR